MRQNLGYSVVLFLGLAVVSPAWALSLKWDAVTTDSTGAPLGAGQQVTAYRVYKCNTPAASCVKSSATLLSTVIAPLTTFNIDAQTVPSSYFVTAVNVVAESPESVTLKVTPPDVPKNPALQTP